MKNYRLLFSLILISLFSASFAQTTDSVDMGNGYGTDVFYSFAKDEVKRSPNNNWDLAFRTGFRTDGIFINSVSSSSSQRSTRLFLYPKGDKNAWNTFDTSGRLSWLEYQNSDSSWEFGAFNRSASAFPDFSWGIYNTVTKLVEGDSLYLLEITNGATKVYKKLLIINKNYGVWNFKYANVDGSNEKTDSIVGSNGNAKNFDYYSIIDGAKLDREPDSLKHWDILFTRYHEFLNIPPTPASFYPVMGIFTNKGVKVAEVRPIDVNTHDYKTINAADYKLAKNVIGSDWKTFNNNTFSWSLRDSLAYYVNTNDGAIWKVVFTGFKNSMSLPVGRSIFTKSQVKAGLSVKPLAPVATFGVYPNPAKNNVELVFENRSNSVKNTLTVYNMAGQAVTTRTLESAPGFYASTMDVSSLPAGVYVVAIENAGHVISQKLIIE